MLLLDHGGPESLVAAVLGGVGAGYRVVEGAHCGPRRRGRRGRGAHPAGQALRPAPDPRQRAAGAGPGDRGDPDLVPAPGLFAPPERFDARPFAPREAAATVLETAVEVLRERGEPARYERLLGEILVGLDRAGQLRRLLAPSDWALAGGESRSPRAPGSDRPSARVEAQAGQRSTGCGARRACAALRRPAGHARFRSPRDPAGRGSRHAHPDVRRPRIRGIPSARPRARRRRARAAGPAPTRRGRAGPVVARRSADREAAAIPLADRVEWAVYSLLSTAGPIAEAAFFERVAAFFSGHDLPDETLVRASLASYRSPASTATRLVTHEDLRRRTAEHAELLAHLAERRPPPRDARLDRQRDQARQVGDRTLGDYLDPHREREPWFPTISLVPKEDGEAVDCIWYQRGASALLLEVEWTAMLGDVLLRRHARIPPDDRIVRFLVLPRAARARAPQARGLADPARRDGGVELAHDPVAAPPGLAGPRPARPRGLEPYLGLDPPIERRAEQLGLFEASNAMP